MESYEIIWKNVLENLKGKVLKTVFDLWFSETELIMLDSERAVIKVGSELKKDIIEKRYVDILRKELSEVIGFDVIMIFQSAVPTGPRAKLPFEEGGQGEYKYDPDTVGDSLKTDKANIYVKEMPAYTESDFQSMIPSSVAARPMVANTEYTFDNFIVGDSNKFAHAASVAVAKNPSSSYNPLFIYGPSGLGKTHLLYAIMNKIKENTPSMNVIYVKGEEFLNELVACIQSGTTPAFRLKYRRADVLLIDDIQFIAGKESVQEEFFHTFNTLYEDNKQIILAADRPPKDMKTLENRLKTRFEWGLIADIQTPDFELRSAILSNKAAKIGFELPEDVLHYLAENLHSNIRQLEGAVKKIGASCFLNGEPVTLELAKNCINDMLVSEAPKSITADKIIQKIAEKYRLTPEDIKSRKKTKEIANARHICIYIIKKLTTLSYPSIGEIFDRDHSTIMSSVSVIETQIRTYPILDVEIKDLIREISE